VSGAALPDRDRGGSAPGSGSVRSAYRRRRPPVPLQGHTQSGTNDRELAGVLGVRTVLSAPPIALWASPDLAWARVDVEDRPDGRGSRWSRSHRGACPRPAVGR